MAILRVNKNELHKSKQTINLDLINVNQIAISGKFTYSGYIKYLENGGKNMSFVIKDDDVFDKYNEIWGRIKKELNIKLYSMNVCYEKFLKDKVREFKGVINFLSNEVPKENVHYASIACITIDSVMRKEKKLSIGLFRRVQIQNEENKDAQIHKHGIRVKVRVRIWHWIIITFLLIIILF